MRQLMSTTHAPILTNISINYLGSSYTMEQLVFQNKQILETLHHRKQSYLMTEKQVQRHQQNSVFLDYMRDLN